MGLYIGKNNIIAINEKVATKQWVTDQHYLTDSNLADYATKTYVIQQIGSINSVLENI